MNPRTVLLVEDDENDVFFLRRSLDKTGLGLSLQVVHDGQEALDYLAGAGEFARRDKFPLPSLVFLDLKLPYVHGFEVLDWIRKEPAFKDLPVVVLTSSSEERDRDTARRLGTQLYLVKPPNRESILQAVRLIGEPAEK